jgi:Flp pilus assembly protein TadG
MFFFGIIDFSRALYAYHFISNAAREGTRYAIVRGGSCNTWTVACPAQPTDVQTFVQNSANGIGLNPAALSVNATYSVPTYDSGGSQVVSCSLNSATGLYDNPGCVVQVQVQYGFNFIFPFMPSGTCTLQAGSQTVTANICMSSSSQMVISQ